MSHATTKTIPSKTTAFETIHATSSEVVCDGGKGPEGHPRVFLYIDRAKGDVTCPYCSRNYVLDGAAAH